MLQLAPKELRRPDHGLSILPQLLSIAKSTRFMNLVALSETGLSPGQDCLLDSLEPGVAREVSDLAADLNVRTPTVSKMIDRLLEAGYVERRRHDSDQRKCLVALTAEGERARRQVHRAWQKMEEDLVLGFSPGEAERVNPDLDRVRELLEQRLRRLR